MIIERIELNKIQQQEHVTILSKLEVGESLFMTDIRQAQSIRSLSYYFLRSRGLDWKFTFRKMDRGWRLIRVR